MSSPFRTINGSGSGVQALKEVRDMAVLNDEMWGQTLDVLREYRTRILALEAQMTMLLPDLTPALHEGDEES
jgi:hypothetical protein